MANQYGLFWNSVSGDRTYDADSFAEWANTFFSTGVFNGDLQVTPTAGMVVNVGTGYANVNGKIRLFEADTTFTLSPASGTYPRVDTIVVRRDEGARQISLAYVMGAYSGLNPVPTPPARDGGIYELVLAQITVGAGATAITVADITDTRADSDLCGWITGSVDSVDVDQLTQQAQAQFMTWFDHMKDQLDEDAAGHLQMEIDTLSDALEAHDIDLGIRETGTTAAQMHRAGQYFMLDHRFCIATQNIAEGDTLEHLVNYNYANIGDELYELKSGLMVETLTASPIASGVTITFQSMKCWGNVLQFSITITASQQVSQYSNIVSLGGKKALAGWCHTVYTAGFVPTEYTIYGDQDNLYIRSARTLPAGSYRLIGMILCTD